MQGTQSDGKRRWGQMPIIDQGQWEIWEEGKKAKRGAWYDCLPAK